MTNPASPPRRKRFQFSLRTLMLAVFFYGAFWLLTIKWGANQIVTEGAGRFIDFNSPMLSLSQHSEGDGHAVISSSFFPGEVADYRASAPFPFVVLSDDFQFDGSKVVRSKRYYVWLFGYRWPLQRTAPYEESYVNRPTFPAKVLAVRNDVGLVMLSVGIQNRIQPGFKFVIYRGTEYQGVVQVDKVYNDMCSAKVVGSAAMGKVMEAGDDAITRQY